MPLNVANMHKFFKGCCWNKKSMFVWNLWFLSKVQTKRRDFCGSPKLLSFSKFWIFIVSLITNIFTQFYSKSLCGKTGWWVIVQDNNCFQVGGLQNSFRVRMDGSWRFACYCVVLYGMVNWCCIEWWTDSTRPQDINHMVQKFANRSK